MDLQTRKLAFIQQILNLQSEEVISQLERLLQKKMPAAENVKPMSVVELNARIDQSEADFENGRFKTSSELSAKYR